MCGAGERGWRSPLYSCPPADRRHIFLGFSKCGRYVLSYTSSSGDDFSFYIYHLYWWEFNVHSKLKLVGPAPLPCPRPGPAAMPPPGPGCVFLVDTAGGPSLPASLALGAVP